MSAKKKFAETDLALAVTDKLQEWGWEVFQEVEGPGGRCDIVARNGRIQMAVECKMGFGFPVLEQAYNWKRNNMAHYVMVAVPYKSAPGGWQLGARICQEHGIGILRVRLYDGWCEVEEPIKPRINRKARGFTLHEDQKTAANAGTNRGGYSTNFSRTKKALISAVRSQPGVEFSALLKNLDHHYSSLSSAKSCLRGFIGGTVIPELKIRQVGRLLCVFPAEIEEVSA